jgi:Bacterial Ig-like domain (group 4)./IPT/TIG domain.
LNVRVTTSAGTSVKVSADKYTYKVPAPRVTGLSPTAGPTLGGTAVTVTGSGFSGATAVSFGTTAAASFSVSSDTTIQATAPAGAGTVDVIVTTPVGTTATSAADQYNYYTPAAITGLSPATGPAAGGTKVTIAGSVLFAASAVKFGTASAVYTVISNSKIVATAPAGTGTVDVRVTTPAGTSAVVTADKYTYVAAPAVTTLSPTTGPAAGGTKVTITGSGFSGASAVKFGTTAASSFSVSSASKIVATAPAGTGTVDVRVTTPAGTSAVVTADRYTYAAPLITVTGVSSIADVPVANGTTLSVAEAALPTTVGITLSNGTSPTVDVTWAEGSSAYDGDIAGSYPFVGTLTNLPVGVTNPFGVTAAVNVNVAASSDTAIVSTLGNVDNTALTITAVPSDTTAGALKAGLSATDSSVQTYAVYESDGTTGVSDGSALTSDDLLVVTAADGSTTASYTITVA